MTKSPYASVDTSTTALNMLALDYSRMDAIIDGIVDLTATLAGARADNAIFICVECGSYMHATPTPDSSRTDQQALLAEHYVIDCCGKENLFSI